LALIRQLRQFAPSIVEVHNSYGLAVRVGRALPHARVVGVLHSPVEMSLAERNAWLSSVDAAVCVSNSVRNALMVRVSPSLAERARTIYNPLPAVPAAPSTDRERIVLFAGRIVPEKGPDAFVAAVAMIRDQLPGWRFLLIGSEGRDPTPAARAFADRVRDQAIAAGVEVLGQLSNATVASIMARAMIVVVPSRVAEALGRVAQEALACGAVVVSSGRGGLPEATGDAALIADPDDTNPENS
jgi:glycosyltransferase involved in cell wall biosynthesis